MNLVAKRLDTIDTLLTALKDRIFTPAGVFVPLRYRPARYEDRQAVLAEDRAGWRAVDRDLVWGEPDGYYWFAGEVTIPPELGGLSVHLRIDAQFGNVMGRSDPQCLVRIDGRIVQGADANHRTVPLGSAARAGARHEIVIEAGTIEDRRQLGFACELVVHDPLAEKLYYDLKVPADVARLLPADDNRRHAILKHVEAALAVLDLRPGNAERFRKSLLAAESHADAIYALADTEAMPRIVATGHTHIDVAWLWRVRETRQKMARSMATALSLMEAYPDYRFMYNQCVLLDYLAEDYPELFERIGEKVAEGQFEIEGALWLEPDVNVSNGEALVRHILYGVAYHEATFGVRPRILWLPDTFGYSAALPQLMERSGLDTFVTHKLSWNDTNRMPYETFHWQGIDGTKVAAYFLTTQPYGSESIGTTYCPDLKPTHVMGAWKRYGQQPINDELFLVYGHGDGGGGPTREMLENVRRMARGIPGCPKVSHEPMRPFFERLLARMAAEPGRFPTWVGELYLEYHRGTLTSVAKNKANNRRAEAALREIEVLASIASARVGLAYPREEIDALWKIVLLNQFHDILPGSSIGPVYDDSDRDYAEFFARAGTLRAALGRALAPAGRRVVFNVLGRARGGLVEVADGGQPIEHADGRAARVARVCDVPAFGGTRLADVAGEDQLSVSERRLSNGRIEVAFDAQGRMTSILDRATGRQVLKDGALGNRLQAYRDRPARYDAWDIDRSFEDQVWEVDDLVSARVTETGPHRAAIRFEWTYEGSRIVQVVSLEAAARQVEVETFIDWREHNTLLKAAFPLALNAAKVRAEIQFGHVERATHANTSWDEARYECSMQRWVEMGEPGFGIALLNDAKYGYDARGTTLRLTLLRSPTYPWPQADQGEHRFRYALMVHDGDTGAVVAAAEDFNQPLLAIENGAAGDAADMAPFLSVAGDGIVAETLKQAEDGEGLILRLWEARGARAMARLGLPAGFTGVAEVDLLERGPQPLPVDGAAAHLSFEPFEVKTIKLRRD
ncbi:alpha-mannosidase [Devosia geojensis]|uniref:Alpha-mannosidase n=1 Tax=Devosia geojensis TaxID=443610 RepID=A0A0F5FTP2_9HYPH|nr:glycoside hydrolase family 38 C-terminal domain-containing protein [Devosia geojensis]KKB11955.1 alpha-mannosidase [Devosia geojensis]